MTTKVRQGAGLEWKLSMIDENGFLLGIYFDSQRKITKSQISIIKSALLEAALKLDANKKGEK